MLSVIYIMLFTLQAEPVTVTHVLKWLYQKSNLYLSVNDFPLMLSAALCSKVKKNKNTLPKDDINLHCGKCRIQESWGLMQTESGYLIGTSFTKKQEFRI